MIFHNDIILVYSPRPASPLNTLPVAASLWPSGDLDTLLTSSCESIEHPPCSSLSMTFWWPWHATHLVLRVQWTSSLQQPLYDLLVTLTRYSPRPASPVNTLPAVASLWPSDDLDTLLTSSCESSEHPPCSRRSMTFWWPWHATHLVLRVQWTPSLQQPLYDLLMTLTLYSPRPASPVNTLPAVASLWPSGDLDTLLTSSCESIEHPPCSSLSMTFWWPWDAARCSAEYPTCSRYKIQVLT